MAPALTQASESPDLTDATRHSLPPKAITIIGLPHDHIKILKESQKSALEPVLTEGGSVLISNGDCFRSGLAPPACGRAEGRPEPSTSPSQFNMEEFPPVSISRNPTDQETVVVPEGSSVPDISMGLQSCIRNINIASDPNCKVSEVVTSNLTNESQTLLSNPNELLELIGPDFKNVNEIINTLKSLASNPELLDATARDLETTIIPSCFVAKNPIDRKSIALNHLIERQCQLERRRNFLACRLNRITARGLGVTISNQLSYLVKYARSIVEKDKTNHRANLRNRTRLESYHRESMKSMSTSDLISLVKRVEANSTNRKDIENHVKTTDSNLSLPVLMRSEINTIVSEWKAAALSHVNHDSDATESSSGGESCDENDQFNKINIDYKPIRQRAFYKFCKNRGWLASKWMWLEAQIVELDNKIAAQEEIHTKFILLKEESLLKRANNKGSRNPADLDMQDPALTCIASPSSTRTMINGYHYNSKHTNLTLENGSDEMGIEKECARTAGVFNIKRQKYANLKKILRKHSSDKFNQQSDIKYNDPFTTKAHCNCSPPISCILCLDSLHSNKTACSSYDNLCGQSIKQKLAVIDSSFHPVLSRKPGVLQSETFNKLLRSWEWQQKAFKGKPPVKASNLVSNNLILNEDTDDESHYEMPSKKRRRELKRNGKRIRDERSFGHRVTRRNHGSSFDDDEDELSGGWAIGSSHSSPCPSPGLERSAKCDKNGSESKGEGKISRKHSVTSCMTSLNNNTAGSSNHRYKQSSNSYDINNIVIPCMPAPPRLETIKYKEIPTPKWRIDDIEPLNAYGSFNVEEDISEETTNARHSRSEALEHKKFLHYLQFNQANSTRSSRSRRTDSSGTNTPDHPLSPRALENSPTCSPPGTPLMVPSEDSLPSGSDIASSDQTVLSLSLSSILSSHKQRIELANPEENSSCVDVQSNKLEISPPKSSLNNDSQDPKPCLRARRILSGHNVERSLRSTSINSIVEEQDDRISPFPSRDFPLTESDYQVLVIESSNSRESSSKTRREIVDNVVEVATINELESGPRDSPLSELTDSALEEDIPWEDESTPDWTISAVHDHSGGFVLQVQKN